MGIKEYYEEDYNILLEIDEQSGLWSQKLFKDIIGDPENLRILDVGVGTGSKIEWLTERNDVYGLEINESAILKSKERGIKVIKADIEKKFPFDDKFFDLVICSQVLEHLVQPQNTMQEINRVLKTEGIFVVDVPNHFGLLSGLHIMRGGGDLYRDHRGYWKDREFFEWNCPHIRFYTYNGFRHFLKINRFEILEDFSDKVHLYWSVSVVSLLFKKLRVHWLFKKFYSPRLFSSSYIFKCRKAGDIK